MHGAEQTARQFARSKGWSKYFGNPCKIHGRTTRYVSNSVCVECQKENSTKYVAETYRKFPENYYFGMRARNRGDKKSPPPQLSPVDTGWWLAGWHDKDMQIGGHEKT